ncbi:DNA-binding transcriptional MocR family regulator [Nocardioides zeae]|uniref:DNA-binding transcriptional MocR family regulator n=2 Tax=Nocardioides zeae TaxID=1457234 RepID=A0ACC6IKP7_9ACTN|nr:PLP-dependent aminotransferase family protein [Nocardioides zeae]MDQ1105018.1 DNA-binding transcriptional MocR family regulator [Nocardioides zeae]MDR6175268.1 DNA-binding transcriptional MocR family regulator [Nocardioides zeae]MDR6211240.1 DNA-binding transcriptional MocR family regulator [Nocardioides zeae]
MSATVTASRIATLVDGFDRSPAYEGLAAALRLAIGDGRVPYGARLPSERDLTGVLAVSRTTVTRAYALLVEQGYAAARRGAGTFAQVPGGPARARDRALTPRPTRVVPRADGRGDAGGLGDDDLVDLVCAACPAPPGIAEAYAAAADELPGYLGGHGYFPTALPQLAEAIAARYEADGLPTTPDQVVVTAGALAGTAIAASALVRTGDRALVDNPVYPNAVHALRRAGARIATAPVGREGWDLDAYVAAVRQAAPRVAYVIPDFQNPTGHLLGVDDRERLADTLRRAHVVPLVDESLRHLRLDVEATAMPPAFASLAADAVSVGSASKVLWGGLRLGWMRLPSASVAATVEARLGLDLGAPVLEQLVLARLLADPTAEDAQRERMGSQRDHLVAALRRHLPSWRFEVPRGGLVLWCELPAPVASRLADEAERLGVAIAAGPQFATGGGLDRFVRLPWTRPPHELDLAVERLAAAWDRVTGGTDGSARGRRSGEGTVLVA